MTTTSESKLLRFCLMAAVAVPIIYFGCQILAAPYFPGYSFQTMAASRLGSSDSQHPWIFNSGAILTGVAAIVAAYGIGRAGRRSGGWNLAACWLVAIGLVADGVSSVKAGIYPLPDPRHTSWGFLVIFMIATPVLLLLLSWTQQEMRSLTLYLAANCVYLAMLVPFMSGMVHAPWMPGGIAQRLFAIAVFVPIGVVGWFHLRRSMAVR